MTLPRSLLSVLLLSAALLLAGCESAEERAERHFQSGMALLAAGDPDRALVEFRNVFKYNGFHKAARQAYADILYDRGEFGEAYGQYLRLIEQYPDTGPVRARLAMMAIQRGDWDEAERHGRAALDLVPDDPDAREVALALDYRKAVRAGDADARAAVAARAEALVAERPEAAIARRLLVDFRVAGEDRAAALAEVEAALEREPQSFELNVMKLRLLAEAEDTAGTGAQLRHMFALFPDNAEVRGALLRWYIAAGDTAGAEAFLREIAGPVTGDPAGHAAVVQFLQQVQGMAAARAELDRLIAATQGHPNGELFRALAAALDFEAGKRTEAIAAMEEILKTAAASDQTRRIKVMLARMLQATGNPVGARARVEEVLAEDPSNVEALKLRAAWAIDADRPADAILDLRAALNQAPRDPQILTLMAQAHERNGARELAGETLALAVEVSGRAPAESLRYAAFLNREGRSTAAVAVLEDALRANPANLDLMRALGDLHLAARDFPRARAVLERIRALGTPEAETTARQAEAAILIAEERTADGIAFLESLAAEGQGNRAAAVGAIVQTHLRAGNPEAARSYLAAQRAQNPADPELRMIEASLSAATGDLAAAETTLRALMAEFPRAEPPAQLLYRILRAQGRAADASAVIDTMLAAAPDSPAFLFLRAEELQLAGDIEGAIAVYERMYARDSSNAIVANNLASLITTFRDDAESLERAAAIARRLRGLDVPAFQDTYGWIEFRRGNLAEAIAHLEPAAKGLPEDPLVQFHLGMAYAAAGRRDEALAQLRRALEIGGDRPLPQMDAARAKIAELGGN
jgi:tetratricopeptide (TPR) repeat protein